MSILQKSLQELADRISSAREILRLDESLEKVAHLEVCMSDPNFWQDQNKAKLVSREVSERKAQIDIWNQIRTDVEDALDMLALAQAEDNTEVEKQIERTYEELQSRYQKLELETLLSDPMDTNNAIVSVHAGAGGVDAMDWAGMIVRMITRFAEIHGWNVEVLSSSLGEEAGYKSIEFFARGRFAYGYLKSEAGVHRLVRISPFDAEKMRHTSFALVEIIPELDELSEKQFEIDEKDLRIDTYMSSGNGGQSVNTTYSAIRITHIPTGEVVTCQNERSQGQNKATAIRILKSRLFTRMLEQRAQELEELKGGHTAPQWGNQIRSYVLHPYQLVKDHRTNVETQDVNRVLDGDLAAFMESYLKKYVSEQFYE